MRLIPASNGEDAQPEPLREDNYCHLPDGKLAPKGQGVCAGRSPQNRVVAQRSTYIRSRGMWRRALPAEKLLPGGGVEPMRTQQAGRRGVKARANRPSPVPEVSPDSPLRKGTPASTSPQGGGIHPSYIVVMRTDDGQEARGVFKSDQGQGERATRNEVATWQVDQMLGIGLTPETVVATVPSLGGRGSLMRFAEGAVNEYKWKDRNGRRLTADEGFRFAVLDFITSQTDRHENNYMRYPDGRPTAIDHGFAFYGGARDMYSEPMSQWLRGGCTGQTSPALAGRILRRVQQADWDAFLGANHFEEEEKQGLRMRVEFVTEHLKQGPEHFRQALRDHFGYY